MSLTLLNSMPMATWCVRKTPPFLLLEDETFDVGVATRAHRWEDQDFQVPFPFTGTIDNLTIALDEPKLTPADIQKLNQASGSAADAQ